MKGRLGTELRGNPRILECLRTGEWRGILPRTEYPESPGLRRWPACVPMQEARNEVLPIAERAIGRVDSAADDRFALMAGCTSLTLTEGMTCMRETLFLNIRNRSQTNGGEAQVPASGTNGATIAQGGRGKGALPKRPVAGPAPAAAKAPVAKLSSRNGKGVHRGSL